MVEDVLSPADRRLQQRAREFVDAELIPYEVQAELKRLEELEQRRREEAARRAAQEAEARRLALELEKETAQAEAEKKRLQAQGEVAAVRAMVARDVNCPRASSAGRLFDTRVIIYAPAENVNTAKLQAMRALGAEVRLHGRDFDEARLETERVAAAEGFRYVHSADEPRLIAGVGAIGEDDRRIHRYPPTRGSGASPGGNVHGHQRLRAHPDGSRQGGPGRPGGPRHRRLTAVAQRRAENGPRTVTPPSTTRVCPVT